MRGIDKRAPVSALGARDRTPHAGGGLTLGDRPPSMARRTFPPIGALRVRAVRYLRPSIAIDPRGFRAQLRNVGDCA